MKVRYLREDEIDLAAATTLNSYERRFGEIIAPPVPVEEILECDLELDFGFEDLEHNFGTGTLGALWMRDRRVKVDTSLDPTLYPASEGRYRFTIGHEIGHWQLHRHLFLADPNQASLLEETSEPSIVCRAGANKPPIEWQADAFSSRLLMPKTMLVRAWMDAKGSVLNRNSRRHQRRRGDPDRTAVNEMARLFKVSAQAMQIRLTDLQIISSHGGASLLR